jgi:hypothetical protein
VTREPPAYIRRSPYWPIDEERKPVTAEVIMEFGHALAALKMGHKVRRRSWIIGDPAYVALDRPHQRLVDEDSNLWHLSHGDVLATDWELADE